MITNNFNYNALTQKLIIILGKMIMNGMKKWLGVHRSHLPQIKPSFTKSLCWMKINLHWKQKMICQIKIWINLQLLKILIKKIQLLCHFRLSNNLREVSENLVVFTANLKTFSNWYTNLKTKFLLEPQRHLIFSRCLM